MSPNLTPIPIHVLIVEDNPVTRKALCLSIESSPQLALSAALDSVKPALAWLETQSVDVLLVDLGLPDGSGTEVIHACSQRHPECDIMVLTMSSDEADVVASIEAGACGYLLKDTGPNDIVEAIMSLRAGGAPMSPAIARMVLSRVRDQKYLANVVRSAAPAVATLTTRETAILELIARGESYGDAAQKLLLSVGTVQTHIKKMYRKLAVHSRGEAVFEAQRRGLLKREPDQPD